MVGFIPRGEVSPFVVVVRNRVIQPPGGGFLCTGVCPLVVIEAVACDPDQVGPGEEEVELVPRSVCKRINCGSCVRLVDFYEFPLNPFKPALTIMISCAQDVVVPVA